MTRISTIEALKIQARAVEPIVRALEEKLGRDEAHRLVGRAIAESWADFAESRFTDEEHPRTAGSPFEHDKTIVTDSDAEYRVNYTRCESADYFRSIGKEDIGALLSCGVDFAVEARRCPEWEFTRTRTLMQGADHCNFCYIKKAP